MTSSYAVTYLRNKFHSMMVRKPVMELKTITSCDDGRVRLMFTAENAIYRVIVDYISDNAFFLSYIASDLSDITMVKRPFKSYSDLDDYVRGFVSIKRLILWGVL